MTEMSDDHSDGLAGDSVDAPSDLIAEFDGIDAAMAAVDDAVGLEEAAATFEAPWQARAFGVAVALHDDDDRDWSAFQEQFVERIGDADPEAMQAEVEGAYYERWLASLEALLREEGLASEAELDRRTAEFAAGERDAAEFVVDDRDSEPSRSQ